MISVVIPIKDLHNYTHECIETLRENAYSTPEIIVVDNASEDVYKYPGVNTLRNERNVGFWPSLLQGIKAARNDIVFCIHNDVFLWDKGWDMRLLSEFQLDPKLAIAGLFGSRGVGLNGGRAYPESNMQGKKYGQHGSLHGHMLTGSHPSVVFDSLAMCFNRNLLYTIDYANIPPHHWTDRLVTLRLIKAGYHALTVGIAFDHGGGFTSTGSNTMSTFVEDWCKERGLACDQNWDLTLYNYGFTMFRNELRCSQLWVKDNYELVSM